jgi:hypothetical protein
MDKSGANLAALQAINAERETPIKRRIRPMMVFKDFRCAASSCQALRQWT